VASRQMLSSLRRVLHAGRVIVARGAVDGRRAPLGPRRPRGRVLAGVSSRPSRRRTDEHADAGATRHDGEAVQRTRTRLSAATFTDASVQAVVGRRA
jgi:hypothetical protein